MYTTIIGDISTNSLREIEKYILTCDEDVRTIYKSSVAVVREENSLEQHLLFLNENTGVIWGDVPEHIAEETLSVVKNYPARVTIYLKDIIDKLPFMKDVLGERLLNEFLGEHK